MRNVFFCVFALTTLLMGVASAAAGRPDFTGVWARDPFPEDDDEPAPGGEPAMKEPYAGQYKAFLSRRKAADKRGAPLVDDSTKCLPEGMPTIMGAVYPIEIMQNPQKIVVLAELFTQTRRIFLNEKMPPLDELVPSYNGYSIGRWDGEVLVVETRGVRDDVRFAPWGFPHSREMKITERFRLTAPGFLEDRIVIEDPPVLARPYVFSFTYKMDPAYKIMEYFCDNNRNRVEADGSVSLHVTPD